MEHLNDHIWFSLTVTVGSRYLKKILPQKKKKITSKDKVSIKGEINDTINRISKIDFC